LEPTAKKPVGVTRGQQRLFCPSSEVGSARARVEPFILVDAACGWPAFRDAA